MTSQNKDARKADGAEKYVRPSGYFGRYEGRRRGDGRRCRLGIRRLRTALSSLLDSGQSRDMPYVMCLPGTEYRGNSYRRHVEYMDLHLGPITSYGLKGSVQVLPARGVRLVR